MKIKYYFEYEINHKPQKPEKGTIEINDREYRIIKTACECREISIKDLMERIAQTLTSEKAEEIILEWGL